MKPVPVRIEGCFHGFIVDMDVKSLSQRNCFVPSFTLKVYEVDIMLVAGVI
jgi:hypothetical protein